MTSHFRPMLAAKTEDLGLRYPVIVSPKLDGIRGLVRASGIVSRKLKPIPNMHTTRLFSNPEFCGMDGELILGEPYDEGVYLRTNSAVMTIEGTPDVRLYVFDDFTNPDLPYQQRLDRLQDRIDVLNWGFPIVRLEYWHVTSRDQLLEVEDKVLDKGYEGLIIRSPQGSYKYGRSTLNQQGMLKLKRFATGECRIVGFIEGFTNQNAAVVDKLGLTKRSSHKENQIPTGTLGALSVIDTVTGCQFEIGTGFTEAQRNEIWAHREQYLGKYASYQYFPIGVKDKPRFPSYRGLRSTIDFDSPE